MSSLDFKPFFAKHDFQDIISRSTFAFSPLPRLFQRSLFGVNRKRAFCTLNVIYLNCSQSNNKFKKRHSNMRPLGKNPAPLGYQTSAGFTRSWKTWKSHGILKWLFPGLEKTLKEILF